MEWDDARNDVGNITGVRELIQHGKVLTRGMREMAYSSITLKGWQRRASVKGEGKIEMGLLSNADNKKECCIVDQKGKKLKSVYFKDNAVTLGAKRKGNVITDLFGLDDLDSPVCAEVKISDGDPWYAVVECVEQVVLLRADRRFLLKNLCDKTQKSIRGVGAWGMVIAPPKYWKKKEFIEAKLLVEDLRLNTKIRICCVSCNDELDKSKILLSVVCGLPPITNLKRSL